MSLSESQDHKAPLWIVFPNVLPTLAQMGKPKPDDWNKYWDEWVEWYLSLTTDESIAYEEQFPEPVGWNGFYRFVSNELP